MKRTNQSKYLLVIYLSFLLMMMTWKKGQGLNGGVYRNRNFSRESTSTLIQKSFSSLTMSYSFPSDSFHVSLSKRNKNKFYPPCFLTGQRVSGLLNRKLSSDIYRKRISTIEGRSKMYSSSFFSFFPSSSTTKSKSINPRGAVSISTVSKDKDEADLENKSKSKLTTKVDEDTKFETKKIIEKELISKINKDNQEVEKIIKTDDDHRGKSNDDDMWENFEFGTSRVHGADDLLESCIANSQEIQENENAAKIIEGSGGSSSTIDPSSSFFDSIDSSSPSLESSRTTATTTTTTKRTPESRSLNNDDEASSSKTLSQKSIACLANYISSERMERLTSVLDQRTQHVRFIFENPSNPQNVWACLRSLDSFGIQFVDIIGDETQYMKGHRLLNMKAAMGSQKWLTLRSYSSTKECFDQIHAEGYTILASDLSSTSIPIMNYREQISTNKIAIVMGNEERGITQEARNLCDGSYIIPMRGMAESFNLSVGTALTLAYLDSFGGIKQDLKAESPLRDQILLRWCINSVRGALPILRREGLLKENKEHLHTNENTRKNTAVLGYKTK